MYRHKYYNIGMKTILCYGDSNTYGYDPRNGSRYPKEQRWPNILANLLENNYEIIAEGLNGRTTAFDRDREDSRNGIKHFKTIFNSHRPIDILIFMLGTNDCNQELHLSSKDISEAMEALILHAKEVATEKQGYIPKIILIAPAAILNDYKHSPFADQLDDYSIIKSKEIAVLYKELAQIHQCIYLDASCLEVSKLDSEHLTINGHQKLAEMLKEVIDENNC